MYKVNQFQINIMNIQGIYNCAHPRLNNKKNMTTVTEEACESDSNDKVNSWRGGRKVTNARRTKGRTKVEK